ncbi:DgyrCDS3537 [Dimorphilus gyrociliatus]|uniref:DgyrCDS3537 n=1 Tax=Dimorphilus gyrociliatus TaxID=2664684 RepID=A0A7I8VDH0_9ANNE|nr:DgyrCDS3537 [Dimorphilus gyrociliatus]
MGSMFPDGKPPGEDFINSWYPILIAVVIGVVYAIRQYMRGAQCQSTVSLKDKIAFVTGGNGGIGFATCADFAERGAKVIMGVRCMEKGQEALSLLKTRFPKADVDVMEIDMASFESIREVVKQIETKYERLNILVNNAGIMCHPEGKSKDGFELHLAVNYLGPYLLTRLLMPLLRKNPGSRVVNVTAHAYRIAEVNTDDLNFESRSYTPGEAYSQSKLAILLDTLVLSKQIPSSEVCINAIQPGVVNTGAQRHMPFKQNSFLRISLSPIVWFLMKAPKDGAQSIIQAAVAEEEKDVTGKLYGECTFETIEATALNEELSQKFTTKAAEMTGCSDFTNLE